MRLFLGMMQKADLMAAAKEIDASAVEAEDQAAKNFRPNRAQRRAMTKMRTEQRWDKKLARHYDIPRALVGNAKRYGSSVEMMLSEHLQQGVIEYKAMPEDGNTST
jgi:hypothetical protein